MPTSDEAQPQSNRPAAWPDLPLVIEQLQDQIDGLRDLTEAQQRQLDDLRARLDTREGR